MKIYNTAFPYFPEEDIDNILVEVREILIGNKMLTMGDYVKQFEEDFARYCGTKYAIATNSCTSALEISLASLNLKPDDEVIVPVQTFIATGSAVLKAGANIVFCDVDEDFLLDFESLQKVITNKTKAVILVHFAGLISPDILKIKEFLDKHNIKLIEDSAHAHGAMMNGKKSGSFGDFGCFSFYSTKIMTTGEGGMITTDSLEFYEKCASLRSRGMDINYKGELFVNLGSNHRVTEIQGLLGCFQLKRLEYFVAHRNEIAKIYITSLQSLIDKGVIRIQHPSSDEHRHAYWRFLVFINKKYNRDCVKKKMNDRGIRVDAPYFPLLHQQPLFNYNQHLSKAEELNELHLSLPIHMKISVEDAKYIANQLKEAISL